MIYDYLNTDENELNSIDIMEVNNIDKNGDRYSEDIYYNSASVRFKLEDLAKYNHCSLGAREIYILILSKLKKDTNILKLNRKDIKTTINISDASISRSIKELLNCGLLRILEKDTYVIPLNKVYKGNLTKMVKLYKAEKEKEEQLKKEEESKNAINYISNKRNLKHKLKLKVK